MRLSRLALMSAFATTVWAQQPLTAEQVLEKSVEAAGGRQAIEKITSFVGKGTLEVPSQGVVGALEVAGKAPNKRLVIVRIEGWGELRRSCDGQNAWEDRPDQGFRLLEGVEREEVLADCVFDDQAAWRKVYSKVELAGKEKIGERETYKLVLTPAKGRATTRYIDAETFLPVRMVQRRTTPQVEVEAQTDLSDYRERDGVKTPHLMKQIAGPQEMIIKLAEVENNVPLEDARFAKPAGK